MPSKTAVFILFTLLSLVLMATDVFAQGEGLGGILRSDVEIETDEEEWPSLLPAGGLVAMGSGQDWSMARRKEGQVSVTFRILYEDGDRDIAHVWVPEEAVEIFTWPCGQNTEHLNGTSICYPFVRSGFFRSNSDWNLRFVSAGRQTASSLNLELVEAFSPSFQGTPERPESEAPRTQTALEDSACSVQQILKMKDSGLSNEQILAACS